MTRTAIGSMELALLAGDGWPNSGLPRDGANIISNYYFENRI
jgi:hypothetical protein